MFLVLKATTYKEGKQKNGYAIAISGNQTRFSSPVQKELYLTHPYDKDFFQLMDRVLEKGTLPRFITLGWFVWWFLHSKRESGHVMDSSLNAKVHYSSRLTIVLNAGNGIRCKHVPKIPASQKAWESLFLFYTVSCAQLCDQVRRF